MLSPIPSAPQAVAGDLAPGAIPEVPDAAPTDTSAGALAPGATTVLQCGMQLATPEERNAAFARVTVRYATVPFRTWPSCRLDARRCARDLPVATMQ